MRLIAGSTHVFSQVSFMQNLRPKQGTALVTGASGGIGLELARILAGFEQKAWAALGQS
jgi:hypothetical protein